MCLFYHLFFLHLQRDHYKSMSYMRCKQLQALQRCLGVDTMWTLQPRFSPQWIERNCVLQEVRREVSIDHCLVNIRVSGNSFQGDYVPAVCRIWII